MFKFQNFRTLFTLFALAAFCLLPELASASGGISELTGPVEKVVGTITGPVGRGIAIFGMALCGIIFIVKRDDLTGGFQLLLGVVFGISFIAFAGSMIDTIFSFSGALI